MELRKEGLVWASCPECTALLEEWLARNSVYKTAVEQYRNELPRPLGLPSGEPAEEARELVRKARFAYLDHAEECASRVWLELPWRVERQRR